MKKIGKLNISSDKLMESEELVALKGGYDIYICTAYTQWGNIDAFSFGENCTEAIERLHYTFGAYEVCCDGCGCAWYG